VLYSSEGLKIKNILFKANALNLIEEGKEIS
jgi:hypothetical protein